MNLLLNFYIAFLLSTLMMPVSIRLGRRLGIVDRPDARKVHTGLVPRTGGLAIALGTLTALFATLPPSRQLSGYLGGGTVILAFGLWDDMRDLNYKIKFLGQILAILFFTLISGIKISCLGELWPGLTIYLGPASILFTVIFVLAVINIINLSDGLDGLAGGLSLLILLACAFLGYVQETFLPIAVGLAVSGGLVGFLRFNMHPAEVFMGDTGSQFLGYSIGVCLIMLTQGESIYSPVLPLFLLGTPVLDTAMVIYERLRSGGSPFKPDKKHLHHKLLRLGFSQEQAVVSIYFFHFLLILAGFFVRFAKDYSVLAAYILVFLGLIFFHRLVQKKDINAKDIHKTIKETNIFLFTWNGKIISARHCISFLSWKFFFIFFFLFLSSNIIYIDNNSFVPLKIITIFLFIILLTYFSKNEKITNIIIYYIMFIFVLYISVYGEIDHIKNFTWIISYKLLHIIFFLLTLFYFGCLILTPEKIPLNALDYILLGMICFLVINPDGNEEIYKIRQISFKAILLGLSLNLIFSRINRNKKYIFFLIYFLSAELIFLILLGKFISIVL